MKWLEGRTRRLSLAVSFSAPSAPEKRIDDRELRVTAGNLEPVARFHRSGYWLFTDFRADTMTVTWKSKHYQDGAEFVDLTEVSRPVPVVSIQLTKPPRVKITVHRLSPGQVGTPYYQQVTTSDGKPPFVFEASHLPEGLNINRETGFIIGIPMKRERQQVILRATDLNGTQDVTVKDITILD